MSAKNIYFQEFPCATFKTFMCFNETPHKNVKVTVTWTVNASRIFSSCRLRCSSHKAHHWFKKKKKDETNIMILMTFLQQVLINVQEKEDHLNKQCYINYLCLKVFHGHKHWAGLFKLNLQKKNKHLIFLTSQKVRLSYSDDNTNFHNRNAWMFFFFVSQHEPIHAGKVSVVTYRFSSWKTFCGFPTLMQNFTFRRLHFQGPRRGKSGMR